MINMKSILTLFALSLSLVLSAQQEAMFTHYMYNTLAVNPGYAGSRDALTITALHRSQWIGFKGAPMTQTLTIHSPIGNSIGLGLSILNDKVGPLNTSSAFVDFAYKLRFKKDRKLALAIKGGITLIQGALSNLDLDNNADYMFTDISSKMLPNFGFGLYYYAPKLYIGFAAPKFLQNSLDQPIVLSADSIRGDRRHYYFIAGGIIDISRSTQFKPTTFVKMTGGAPLQFDLTTSFIFNEKFSVGAMYRLNDAIGLLVGIQFSEKFEISCSYDWSLGLKSGTYNSGSAEVMLRYDIEFGGVGKIRSPRYF